MSTGDVGTQHIILGAAVLLVTACCAARSYQPSVSVAGKHLSALGACPLLAASAQPALRPWTGPFMENTTGETTLVPRIKVICDGHHHGIVLKTKKKGLTSRNMTPPKRERNPGRNALQSLFDF